MPDEFFRLRFTDRRVIGSRDEPFDGYPAHLNKKTRAGFHGLTFDQTRLREKPKCIHPAEIQTHREFNKRLSLFFPAGRRIRMEKISKFSDVTLGIDFWSCGEAAFVGKGRTLGGGGGGGRKKCHVSWSRLYIPERL